MNSEWEASKVALRQVLKAAEPFSSILASEHAEGLENDLITKVVATTISQPKFRLVFTMSSSRSSILFLVLCFGCGGTAAVDRQYADMKAEHQDAKTQLTEAGAKLEQKQYPPGKAWRVDLTGQQITDETFSAMDKLGPVSELLLSGTNLSDEHAAAINESGIGFFLLILDVSDTEFSDAGLAQITGGKYMQELNVKGSKVTAEGIKQFKQTHPGISVIE